MSSNNHLVRKKNNANYCQDQFADEALGNNKNPYPFIACEASSERLYFRVRPSGDACRLTPHMISWKHEKHRPC